jgi:8-oxo-dGTP diphosphatase
VVEPIEVVRRFVDALDRGDLEAALAHCDPDGSVEIRTPTTQTILHGREACRDAVAPYLDRYQGALDDGGRVSVDTMTGVEEGWVAVEWGARLVDRATGETLSAVGSSFLALAGTRIARQRHRVTPVAVEAVPPRPSPRSYPARPVVGVGAVVLVGDRVVLVERREAPLAGQWTLPGGVLEVGETLQAGVAREIREETGLQVDVGPLVEVFDRILFDRAGRVRYHFVLVDYLCWPRGGQLRAGSDVADVKLAAPDELDRYWVSPKARAVVARALALASSPPR